MPSPFTYKAIANEFCSKIWLSLTNIIELIMSLVVANDANSLLIVYREILYGIAWIIDEDLVLPRLLSFFA